jgi:hypothetical protein
MSIISYTINTITLIIIVDLINDNKNKKFIDNYR